MSFVGTHERGRGVPLATVFQVSLYALVALSSTMLAISEGIEKGVPPQVFTVGVILAAYFLVDRRRTRPLPWWAAGSLGLASLVVAFWNVPEYLHFEKGLPVLPEERRLDLIFAGAHLLVFLTWIVLFLEKTNQQFWWLWALGILQVAVGASQSTETMFGLFLVVYLFLAIWTLSVFSLVQGQQQFDRAGKIAETTEASLVPDETDEWTDPKSQGGRLELWKRPSRAIGNVQRDPTASWINPRFVTGVLGTATLALLVALLFFFLIPRHPAIWRRSQTSSFQNSSTGFSRQLSLGDIGQILESTKKVMTVRLTDFQTGARVDIQQYAEDLGFDEPLFRGMVTVEYENGSWQSWEPNTNFEFRELTLPGLYATSGRYMQQQIHLEPIDPELLFAMPPAIFGEIGDTRDAIHLERFNDILKKTYSRNDRGSTDYTILSPRRLKIPGSLPVRREDTFYLRRPNNGFLRMPRGLPRLRQIAIEKSGFDSTPRPNPRELSQRLLEYLRNSGEFGYTLNANVQDPDIDPLEDFLVNRKVGHCEYFASALVLMLRTVQIPARLVSGFKGGTYNDTTGLYEIEERHAHAWVEAYVDGRWFVLDPTPAARAESVASVGQSVTRWSVFRTGLSDFWRRFVVQLNVAEQRQLLAPLKQLYDEVVDWMRNGRTRFSDFVKGLAVQLKSPERWISWQGGLVTFVFLTLVSGLVFGARRLVRLIRRLRQRFLDPEGLGRTIAFYERFRRVCRKAGYARRPAQTPREFAKEIRRRFRTRRSDADWGSFPLSLVEAYYDVRYGGRSLSEESLAELMHDLTRFETLIESPPSE